MLDHVPSQDLKVLVTGMLVQKETGGNLAEILDRTASVIRERLRIQGEIRTHTAQGRLTGWILSLLPVVLGVALYFVSPEMMSILWTRPLGVKLLWTSAGMTCVGGMIIRHIVNMEV